MKLMNIYNKLPRIGQNIACTLIGHKINSRRYSKSFWRILHEYQERDTWTLEQQYEYRDIQLQKIVQYAYRNIPYYQRIMNEGGISPNSIRYLDDLRKLPILTKDIVKENILEFATKQSIPNIITCHTSGTTGSGLVFKSTIEAQQHQWAVWWRYRQRLGIPFGMLCGVFGGRSVVPAEVKNPPFYRVNKAANQILFSGYHMSAKNMPEYIRTMVDKRISWLHGYPSTIALIAQFIVENEIKLPYKVQFITTGAENLLEQQKKIIHDAFGIFPYNHYGMSEGVANISETLEHHWRIDEDYAAVELVYDEDADSHHIIGTSLWNYAMPFLRYDVGDYCSTSLDDSRHSIRAIDGRKEDYIILKDGSKIGRLDHIFKDMVHVKEAQIYQDKVGNVEIRVVQGSEYDHACEIALKKECDERFGGRVNYIIKYVDCICKTSSGKLRFAFSDFEASK